MGQGRHHQRRGTSIEEAHQRTGDAPAERSAPADGRRASGAVEVWRGSGAPGRTWYVEVASSTSTVDEVKASGG
jgi:hypothetical protein